MYHPEPSRACRAGDLPFSVDSSRRDARPDSNQQRPSIMTERITGLAVSSTSRALHCDVPQSRSRRSLVAVLALAAMAACGGGGGGGSSPTGEANSGQAELQRVEYGRLVDVYGLRITGGDSVQELYQKDVLIGSDIEDQRGAGDALRDDEILYDFFGSDPDTLQPRLFIPRDVTSAAFKSAFDALDDRVREVSPMAFGGGGPGLPFSVVPRNAAIRLVFSAPLSVDDSFFVERDTAGFVTGVRNVEAVQLLKIVGDPAQPNAFVPLPSRVVVQGRGIVIDPVLLGTEGLQYQTDNNAAGLPESPDQVGANLRIAVALDGPLAIPGVRGDSGLTGLNNSARRSLIRDFRSGNDADSSSDMTAGFARDPLPLRLLGELVMYLERVEEVNAQTQEITIYKGGIVHEIDRGDVIRILADSSGLPFGSAVEVVADPDDDRGQPAVQHVRVRIRRIPNLTTIDPRNLPGYPSSLSAREPWLVANAPRSVLVTEYEAGGRVVNGVVVGDDPRYFLRFTPTPLANLDGSKPAPNEFVSPFAGAVVRFTKPVNMTSVRWADTFFFAMRDLATSESIEAFIANRPNSDGTLGMDPGFFNLAKYRTPNLITARVYDEDGSQTALRLQPSMGFYLDDTMRNPPAGADYRYFLHLIADSTTDGGIRDLAGNPLDLQGDTADRANNVVIPFTVDTRVNGNEPFFEDNLAVSVVQRFASRDENANPSYYLASEVPAPGKQIAAAFPLEDLVGGFVYVDGKLLARPTTRTRVIADNRNQAPVAQQGTPLAWCPFEVTIGTVTDTMDSPNTAFVLFGQGIQNPLNPYGCRLQTVWREVDLSLSRTDAFDFNLDIEQMYWAPFTGTILGFDEFDSTSLYLGHSEYRPVPCTGAFSALPSLLASGLRTDSFQRNFVWNPGPAGGTAIQSQPAPHAAYIEKPLTIDPAKVVLEPTGVNRFLPLPEFRKPYFVYRDETVIEQGCNTDIGADTTTVGYKPYILTPFSHGQGRRWTDAIVANVPTVRFSESYWNDMRSTLLTGTQTEDRTGGLVGNIALPLIADFQTFADRPDLPVGNGWQVALPVQSSTLPNFRVLSAGRPPVGTTPAQPLFPSAQAWSVPSGAPAGGGGTGAPAGDNTFYWIMLDVLKRQSVITAGFVDLNNPHRVPEGFVDPRLGPFYLANGVSTRPANVSPNFAYEFDPPLTSLPPGTSVVPQFRAAGIVDPTPWYWDKYINTDTALGPTAPAPDWSANERAALKPTAQNFPLDPWKAGDAHIRKWDTRPIPGGTTARNWWTYFYNRTVTEYTEDPNTLVTPVFTAKFGSTNEPFTPRDVRYVNWRFVTSNNVDANPPISPAIETFALSYRFERTQ